MTEPEHKQPIPALVAELRSYSLSPTVQERAAFALERAEELLRAAWRAGRIAERERCAALCEGLAKVMTPDRRSTAEDLARAIREDQP